jgi:predicted PurR-regulated permease PerM
LAPAEYASYIGGIIAIALPVIIATVTKDGFSTQLGVIGAYALIQFIDNNFLVPFLVSSRVKIMLSFLLLWFCWEVLYGA